MALIDDFDTAVSALTSYKASGQALADANRTDDGGGNFVGNSGADDGSDAATGYMVVQDASAALKALQGGRTPDRIANL